ncbi:family 10 glycosylhydrolase [Paenactinomyces guangxiensis]|uniref:Family 10 glycosylhydrolase n=1 Tax=Paenactinomyces guangxiensis TaxID=1490290 RepID=A0A7W2A9X4_9BACL|nr:family 10 glycosylhydrolase [Paenactinomyces guangxiensis]MBA4495348.1 family 10 glycosylhydrolase [Paenactinomyces guangxiensis]MBH8592531.1 family 10 glycosylhydrolase [Paenactinomyces guangxiensis]
MKKYFLVLLLLILAFSIVNPLSESATTRHAFAASPELRAFWVDMFHNGAKTPAQVDQLLQDVKRSNANAIFVQVRRRGDAYYNNSLEPRTEDPALPAGYDPLQDLIQKAHASSPRIEVHAWFAMMPIWNSSTPPKAPNHVFNQHGFSRTGRDMWLSKNYSGSYVSGSDYVIDPGNPDAADYTINVVKHVAANYNIDGVHMDLIRYMGSDWGYNPTSVQRFNQRYGRTGTPSPGDETWKAWRREQVNLLVQKMYVNLLAIKPNLVVSAATIAWGNGPKTIEEYNASATMNSALQDWNHWLQNGWIDLAVPMNYFREHDSSQRTWYENWLAWEKDHQYGRKISSGTGVYLNSISNGLTQIRKAQQPSAAGNRLAGVHIYSYAVTNKDGVANSEFYNALSQPSQYDSQTPVFAEQVAPPSYSWKTNPTKGHLAGSVLHTDGTISDHEAVVIRGPQTKTVYTDGSGDFQAIDLSPGTYTVTSGSASKVVTITAGKVSSATLTN